MDSRHTFPAEAAMRALLEEVYPGSSAAARRLREEILDFCRSPMVKVVLLTGPSGAGKTTVARLLAYLKAYALADRSVVERLDHFKNLAYSGPFLLDVRMMDWYVELPLTGLVEDLAESQLFGVTTGAYTGARSRTGVFEQASSNAEASDGQPTRGVVFLDEVGDLTPRLQAKLLPVLSRGVTYRVGGEGDPKHRHEYHGVLITASWKNLEEELRHDLYARLTANVIEVPSLDDRKEDLPLVVEALAVDAIQRHQQEIKQLTLMEKLDLDKELLRKLGSRTKSFDKDLLSPLLEVPWSEHLELRGLSNAIEKVVVHGRNVQEVIEKLPRVQQSQTRDTPSHALLELASQDGAELTECVKALERKTRKQLKDQGDRDPAFRAELARRLGVDESKVMETFRSLTRKPRRK